MWTCHGDCGLYDLMLMQQMELVIGMKLSLPINTEDLMIVWDHEKLLYYRGGWSPVFTCLVFKLFLKFWNILYYVSSVRYISRAINCYKHIGLIII